jgi:hypothetical protein
MEAMSQQAAGAPTKVLSAAQRERYGAAIAALKHSSLGREPKSLGAALDIAIHHCEKARAFDWSERRVRARRREVAANWDSVNKAAKKLAIHFDKLDDRIGSARLHAAILKSGLKMRPQTDGALHSTFAQLLRALAEQPEPGGYDDRIGPLKIQISSRKLPSRETVLIILLAHLFDRVANHCGHGDLQIEVGEPISNGRALDIAGLFASATLGSGDEDPRAAKKFLHDHRDQLFYAGWPESGTG